MFTIEDERHAEPLAGQFESLKMAIDELRRLASLPWDKPPNVAPCQSWRKCGRTYEIVEYETSSSPWRELSRVPYLDVDESGTRWLGNDVS